VVLLVILVLWFALRKRPPRIRSYPFFPDISGTGITTDAWPLLVGGKRCGTIANMRRISGPLIFATIAGAIAIAGHLGYGIGTIWITLLFVNGLIALWGFKRLLDIVA
jgi:hypothetical protein